MAGLFGGECPACPVKDAFIAFLQKQNQDFAAKLAEVASPGANARQAYVPPAVREKKGPAVTHSPSRLAATRKDAPPEHPAAAPVPNPRVSEADFER